MCPSIKRFVQYLSIFITLTALITLAYLKDNEIATFLANKIAGNRINSHDKAILGINILYFSLFLLLILPIISFYNWLHYIGVVIYRKITERIKQKNDAISSSNIEQ